jgi:small subunit ribosomal protein S20
MITVVLWRWIMPNIKSAKKRVLVTAKKSSANNDIKTSMKTALKKCSKTPNVENLVFATKKIDKACNKSVIKKNTADRYKSRLTKLVNETK